MEDQVQLYNGLQELLLHIKDEETLKMADRQMSMIENEYPELLQKAAKYLMYFPKEYDLSIKIAVLGNDSHYLAHAIEMLYPNAEIYWITDITYFDEEYIGKMDYFVATNRAMSYLGEKDLWKQWCQILNVNGKGIVDLEKFSYEVCYFYDLCNLYGMLIEGVDSNTIAYCKKIDSTPKQIVGKKKYRTVYVVCPACAKTGGTELLYQLVYWINAFSGNAVLALRDRREGSYLCHPALASYVAGHICCYEEIEDAPENVVIVPEIYPNIGFAPRKAKQFYWWLSVDNYIKFFEEKERTPLNMLIKINQNCQYHLVQSEYARDYLLRNGIPDEKIVHLADYINQSYLDRSENALQMPKQKKERNMLIA